MANVGNLVVSIMINSSQFTRGISAVQSSLRSLGSSMQAMGMAMTAAFTVPIVTGFYQAAKEGISFNASLETINVGLTNIMGSAELANTFISQMMEYSGKTPFDFEAMTQAATGLVARGVDANRLFADMVIMGDQLAFIGRTGSENWSMLGLAMGQISSKQRLMGQEINQLAELGVNGYEMIAKAMGTTIDQAKEWADTATGMEAYDAILKGMEQTSKGSAEKMGETFTGVMANIRENTKFALGELFKPVFEDLKPALAGVLASIEAFRGSPEFKEWAEALENTFKRIKETAIQIGEALKTWGQALNESGVEGKEAFIQGLIGLAAAGPGLLVVAAAVKAITAAVGGLETLGALFGAGGALASLTAEGGILAGLGASAGTIAAAVAGVVAAIVAAGVALYQFYQENEEFRAMCADVWADVMQVVSGVAANLAAVWGEIGPSIMAALEMLWDGFKTVIGGIAEVLVNFVGFFADIMTGDMTGAIEHLKGIGTGLLDILSGLFWTVIGLLEAALGTIIGIAASIVGGVLGAFSGLIDQGIASWQSMLSGIYSALEGAVGGMMAAGSNLVQGLIDGIDSMIGTAKAKAAELADAVSGAVTSFLGIQSPSKLMHDVGVNVVQGLANGIYDAEDAATEAARNLADNVKRAVEALKEGFTGLTDTLKYDLSMALAGLDISISRLDLDEKLTEYQREAEKLALELEKTQKEVTANADQIAVMNEMIAAQVQLTGEDSEQVRDLQKELAQLQVEQARLAVEAEKATIAIEKQALAMKEDLGEAYEDVADLNKELAEAEEEANQDRLKAALEYAENRKQVEEQLAADIEDLQREHQAALADIMAQGAADAQAAMDEYASALESKTSELYSWTDLFGSVDSQATSGSVLLQNLKGQVSAFDDWSANIATLAARGIDDGLLEELRKMGPDAGAEIAALNQLTDSQLTEYTALWKRKNEQAKTEAVAVLADQKVAMEAKLIEIRATTARQIELQNQELQAKLMEMQAAADAELEKYKKEWQETNKEIETNSKKTMASIADKFNKLAAQGKEFGLSLWEQFSIGSLMGFQDARTQVENYMAQLNSLMSGSSISGSNGMRAYASGGYVPNTGPALLHAGEYVLNASAFSALADLLRGMNQPAPAAALAGSGGTTNYITINSNDENAIMRALKRLGVK